MIISARINPLPAWRGAAGSVLVLAFLALGLAGCSGALEGKKIDYKSAGKLPPLEVPPDLAAPGPASRYSIPDAGGADRATSYSEYEKGRTTQSPGPAVPGLLRFADGIQMQRGGIQRWLVVQAAPERIWPVIKDFWQENGFLLAEEEPQAGYMETDWSESRAKVPVGGLTGLLNRALDSVVSLPERDKFRTRLERGLEPDTTEIYLSHKGLAEVYYRERDNNTRWQARPSDPELEAAMLARLAARLGVKEPETVALARAADAAPARASLVKTDAGTAVALTDGFDRAWRRVGLALDRVGFMVEDRNRSEGVYFVKYQDPEAEAPKRKGAARLAFWRSDEKKGPEQYRIRVTAATGDGGSEVRVLKQNGAADEGETAQRILGLLVEQLK
ncbi:MAG: outer membrane protein assembly factor BamC [Betaproteobacteria bacterium]|jgi:outer membrane protein assembly factor BamC